MLCKVAAVEKGRLPWCIPMDRSSRVMHLASAVQDRENKLLGKNSPISVAIQLEVNGDLCAVDPEDLLDDLDTSKNKDTLFVAVRIDGGVSASSRSLAEASGKAAPTAPSLKKGPLSSFGIRSGNKLAAQDMCIGSADLASSADKSKTSHNHKAALRMATTADTATTWRRSNGGADPASSRTGTCPSRPTLSRSSSSLGPRPTPDSGCHRTQGRAKKKARRARHPQLQSRASAGSRWKAAEALVVTAAILHGTSDDQDEAYAFLSELAGSTEAGRQLGQRLKAAAIVDGNGTVVERIGIVKLCETDRNPGGYVCLSRYLLGNAYPDDEKPGQFVRFQDLGACFSALVRNIRDGPAHPLEKIWVAHENAVRFKWTGQGGI